MQTESSSLTAEPFTPPAAKIGDMVFWYHDPLSCADPCIGWVCDRPGVQTLTLLVFSRFAGFQEKPSVRHRSDPGLQENAEWRQWGCWEYAPITSQMKKLDGMMAQIAAASEQAALSRKQSSGTKNG